ncbi:Isochorismatase hydrolase [Hypoxylon trugodes]|uniref:Isochorismatase hydrolase n=1 Tax=Hypoxylon trugodes TaxID=326681 RepID=UPI0021976996|nr:Isochorismatase hydrolase [Hypoxylon trugodes]KAI1383822.1 Isochorismatase hydrolase [Hypoxylon trugodes]
MKSANTAKTALVIIDVQNGFRHPTHWGASRSTPECEDSIALLLKTAREHNEKQGKNTVVICHVHHHSIYPDSMLYPGAQIEIDGKIVDAVQPQPFATPNPGEPIFVKNVNSSFIGTNLENYLKDQNIRQLIILGLTTDHCVSTTTRMASNLRVVSVKTPTGELDEGDIILVRDACATFSKGDFDAEIVHKVNLASLNEEFAQVANTQDVLRVVFG